jgi:hypothetical protein
MPHIGIDRLHHGFDARSNLLSKCGAINDQANLGD